MIESPSHNNIADFKQRYSGVFGWLNPKDGRQRVFVKNVSATRVTFTDPTGHEYYANVDAGVDFEFLPAEKAWAQTSLGLFLIQRIPARQWKRGICVDNTSIREVHDNGSIGPLTTSFNAVVFSIMGEPPNYKRRVDHYLANQGQLDVALSRHFALIRTKVCFFGFPVGTINKNNATITLDTSMVYQELVDLCYRNNYPFKVNISA